MPSGPTIILVLKMAVIAVTVLLGASLIALYRGNYRLHGRLNIVFFILTLTAVVVFETLLQLGADVTTHMTETERLALRIHLFFAVPLPIVLGVMLFTGLKHFRRAHIRVSVAMLLLWAGTFITGVFFLPHTAP